MHFSPRSAILAGLVLAAVTAVASAAPALHGGHERAADGARAPAGHSVDQPHKATDSAPQEMTDSAHHPSGSKPGGADHANAGHAGAVPAGVPPASSHPSHPPVVGFLDQNPEGYFGAGASNAYSMGSGNGNGVGNGSGSTKRSLPPPFNAVTEPLKSMADPVKSVSTPLNSLDSATKPLSSVPEQVNTPLNKVTQPLNSGPNPVSTASQPLTAAAHPVNALSQPLHGLTNQGYLPVSEEKRSISPGPRPVKLPVQSVAQPLKGLVPTGPDSFKPATVNAAIRDKEKDEQVRKFTSKQNYPTAAHVPVRNSVGH